MSLTIREFVSFIKAVSYWWSKPKYTEKTDDLQLNNFFHINLYHVHLLSYRSCVVLAVPMSSVPHHKTGMKNHLIVEQIELSPLKNK